MKKLLPLIALLVAGYFGWQEFGSQTERGSVSVNDNFAESASGSQVQGSGIVVKILPDDNDGSRHQRFILRLDSGRTLLVAHNIDLAPRIASLREGDTVAFNGVYEWNAKGGVIHWTHHDPTGRHVAGWLKHDGHSYE
ncbi:MAG: DUF3465 domain-containing protein [Gammaproteobacteria bacterium]|nr:DUF3465 domain-containing protein [Gammaproteobacteria bacterium]